jgi:hypothetical protein
MGWIAFEDAMTYRAIDIFTATLAAASLAVIVASLMRGFL